MAFDGVVVHIFSTSHGIRSKRQADDNEDAPQYYFNDQSGICALGRHENGSAFAVFFQDVSEFEVCGEVDCIPPPIFQIQHTSKEECEDAVGGVPTCVSFTHFLGFNETSHCNLPINWDDRFPTRQTFAELEYCGIEMTPILILVGDVRLYQFQKASDCEYLASGMPLNFPTATGYQSPFDMKVGVCTFTFYTNYTFAKEWCAVPSRTFSLASSKECDQGPVTEDVKYQEQMPYFSKHECSSVKVLEIGYQFTLKGDPFGYWR